MNVTGNRLSVSGKREAERQDQSDRYYTYERSYGEFMRTFTLPDGADTNQVGAELKDGVLTITVKKSPALQAKKVAVQTAPKS